MLFFAFLALASTLASYLVHTPVLGDSFVMGKVSFKAAARTWTSVNPIHPARATTRSANPAQPAHTRPAVGSVPGLRRTRLLKVGQYPYSCGAGEPSAIESEMREAANEMIPPGASTRNLESTYPSQSHPPYQCNTYQSMPIARGWQFDR